MRDRMMFAALTSQDRVEVRAPTLPLSLAVTRAQAAQAVAAPFRRPPAEVLQAMPQVPVLQVRLILRATPLWTAVPMSSTEMRVAVAQWTRTVARCGTEFGDCRSCTGFCRNPKLC
jgi:hypothetical protein